MRNKLSDYQEQYGDLYNLEATPAESTSYRLAKHDKAKFPKIITASEGKGKNATPYYTNSSHLPVGFTDDIFKALEIQDELQTLYTSGTVFHAFLGQKLDNWKTAANLVRKIAENFRLPYYTLSPTYSVCAEHGYLEGEHERCPYCNAQAEVYSRITGYYRPVQNWNNGKLEEFDERKEYVIETSQLHPHAHANCGCEQANTPKLEKITLFSTPTCPNCKLAKGMLDKAKVKYLDVDAIQNKDLSNAFSIKKAPTLLVPKENGFDVYDNASAIREYIGSLK